MKIRPAARILFAAFLVALVFLSFTLMTPRAFAQGAPEGECPPNFTLISVEALGDLTGISGVQSIDVNQDELTCIKVIAGGNRVAIIDNISSAP